MPRSAPASFTFALLLACGWMSAAVCVAQPASRPDAEQAERRRLELRTRSGLATKRVASRPVAATSAPAEANVWGSAVDGVRCRLRPVRSPAREAFGPGEPIVFSDGMMFLIDIESDRRRQLPVGPAVGSEYELSMDGSWYAFDGPDYRNTGPVRDRASRDIWLYVSQSWIDPVDGTRIQFTDGFHVIQVAVGVPADPPGSRTVRVVSNPVLCELHPRQQPRPGPSRDTIRWPSFHGLDLRDPSVPVTTGFERLPDLFREVPPGSRSYELRPEVQVLFRDLQGTVYVLPQRGTFYVQCDFPGSSRLHYYGPFRGDPRSMMQLPPASQPATRPPGE